MESPSLEKGQIFYGLALSGNHQQSCLFVEPSDLFLAFFDEIYISDLLGESNYFLKANSAYSKKFRFENALRIFQYRVTETIDDIEPETGLLKIPVWASQEQQTLPLGNFEEWLSLLTRREIYREDYPILMYDLSKHRDNIEIVDAHRVKSAELFKAFYDLVADRRSPSTIKIAFAQILNNKDVSRFLERDLSPKEEWKNPLHSEFIKYITDGEDAKTLYRIAALDIETYKYVQSEDFYEMLWKRDLPVNLRGQILLPEFYTPWLGYSWNYLRFFDIETVKLWVETRKKLSNLKAPLSRFDSETLSKMKEISMVGACYKLRVIITGNFRSDRLTLVSNAEFLEEVLSTFVDRNANWIKVGYVSNTAVPKPSFLELRLERLESQNFLTSFLNYLVREKMTGAFRFG